MGPLSDRFGRRPVLLAGLSLMVLSFCTEGTLSLMGIRGGPNRAVTEEEIAASLEEGLDAGVIEAQEHQMVRNVFRLDPTGRPLGIELILPDWFYAGVIDQALILTIDRAYFDLAGGLERWLYRIVRKHGGRQRGGWSFDFAHLHLKSGVLLPRKKFAFALRDIVRRQSLPGYRLAIEFSHGRERLRFASIPLDPLDRAMRRAMDLVLSTTRRVVPPGTADSCHRGPNWHARILRIPSNARERDAPGRRVCSWEGPVMTRFGYAMVAYFTSLGTVVAAFVTPAPRLIWNASASRRRFGVAISSRCAPPRRSPPAPGPGVGALHGGEGLAFTETDAEGAGDAGDGFPFVFSESGGFAEGGGAPHVADGDGAGGATVDDDRTGGPLDPCALFASAEDMAVEDDLGL
eukprot:gene41586-56270_t